MRTKSVKDEKGQRHEDADGHLSREGQAGLHPLLVLLLTRLPEESHHPRSLHFEHPLLEPGRVQRCQVPSARRRFVDRNAVITCGGGAGGLRGAFDGVGGEELSESGLLERAVMEQGLASGLQRNEKGGRRLQLF